MLYRRLFLTSTIIVSSCTIGIDDGTALCHLKKNCHEISSIDTYNSIRQKRRAKNFLLKNMPYHWSFDSLQYYSYRDTICSLLGKPLDESNILKINKIIRSFQNDVRLRSDIECIAQERFVQNIDSSFKQWQSSPYLRHLSFEEFCEYILPYKCIDGQPIDIWKDYTRIPQEVFYELSQIDEYSNNPRPVVERANQWIQELYGISDIFAIENLRRISGFDYNLLLKLPCLDCFEKSLLGCMIGRANGLPVVIDFTPNWPDRQGGHTWNTLISNNRHNIDYIPFDGTPGNWHFEDAKYAKVFRHSFSAHPVLAEAKAYGYHLPTSLSDICITDVTEEYCKTTSIKIPINRRVTSKFIYLAVFDDRTWVPVDIAKNKHHSVFFEKVGCDVLYALVTNDESGVNLVSSPFYLGAKSKVLFFNAKQDSYEDIVISRKYPARAGIWDITHELNGWILEGSNSQLFEKIDTSIIVSKSELLSGTVELSKYINRRHWRLSAIDGNESCVAEVFFMKGEEIKTPLVATPSTPHNGEDCYLPYTLQDRDQLTYFRLSSNRHYIDFDLGEDSTIDRVHYIMRGDGNSVQPGDLFSLYYWKSGWQLVSTKRAVDIYIEFDDVPSGALYILTNDSRGGQVRPFYVDEKKIHWL